MEIAARRVVRAVVAAPMIRIYPCAIALGTQQVRLGERFRTSLRLLGSLLHTVFACVMRA